MDMELRFRLRESALKHEVTEADIEWAFRTDRYDLPVEGYENKRLLIGCDTKANPIEILYNEFGNNGVNVFHAMECQSRFLRLLEEGELL
jgi:hypothetical protein